MENIRSCSQPMWKIEHDYAGIKSLHPVLQILKAACNGHACIKSFSDLFLVSSPDFIF